MQVNLNLYYIKDITNNKIIPSSIILPKGDPHFNLLALSPSIISKIENHCKQRPANKIYESGTISLIVRLWLQKYSVNKTNGNYPNRVIVFADHLYIEIRSY